METQGRIIPLISNFEIELVTQFEPVKASHLAMILSSYLKRRGYLIFWESEWDISLISEVNQDGKNPVSMKDEPLPALSKFFLRTILVHRFPQIRFMHSVLVKFGKLHSTVAYPELDFYLHYPAKVA